MKITKIVVTKLFGVFDHEIELNTTEGITIVIGENGLGKTVILEILDSIFGNRFQYLKTIEFEKIIIEFDDNLYWVIKKENENINVSEWNNKVMKFQPIILERQYENMSELRRIARNMSREIPFIRLIGPDKYRNIENGRIYNSRELVDLFGDDCNYKNEVFLEKQSRKWFNDRLKNLNVTLIKTQRLIYVNNRDERGERSMVDKYSHELLDIMTKTLSKSMELSSNLDSTYPNRLISTIENRENLNKISNEELSKKLNELEELRNSLNRVGLVGIVNEQMKPNLKLDKSEDIINLVLLQYVDDSFEKLKIFKELTTKIELLLEIVNKRFKHKQLFINKNNGFQFKSTVKKDKNEEYVLIPVDKLSSGEQNELVLFYELIFKTQEKSLILIDEPEISLHISWQNKFMEDLKKIHKLNELNILIATHSPDIIGNNWNLKVQLKGVE